MQYWARLEARAVRLPMIAPIERRRLLREWYACSCQCFFKEVSGKAAPQLVVVILVTVVAQAFIAACFLSALTSGYALPSRRKDRCDVISDTAHVPGAPGHIVKEHQSRGDVRRVAIERSIEVVSSNA